jgi:glycogen debranching enzyme
LNDACVGSIGEVFDADPPFLPRGCIAQAWSVAEVLRCWLKGAQGSGGADLGARGKSAETASVVPG